MTLSGYSKRLLASALGLSIATMPVVGLTIAQAQTAPSAEAPGDATWQKEFEAWRSASKAGTVKDYEAYLRTYPQGKFAAVARKRIDDLNAVAKADAAKVESLKAETATPEPVKADPAPENDVTADAAKAETQKTAEEAEAEDAEKKRDLEMWREASKTGTRADYEKYLKEFPEGRFAKVAKTRIDGLIAKAAAPAEQDSAAANTDARPMAQDEAQAGAEAQQVPDADPGADVADQAVPDNDMPQQDEAAPQDAATADADQGAQAQSPVKTEWEQEYALWKAASDGNTVPEYEAYLKAYPSGKFAAIAQARIVQLAAAEQPASNISEGDVSAADQQPQASDNEVSRQDDAEPAQSAQRRNDDDNEQASLNRAEKRDKATSRTASRLKVGSPETEDEYLGVSWRLRQGIQQRLTALGYDTMGSDGTFGPRTRQAIADWQRDNGAEANGYLSRSQISLIRRQAKPYFQ